MDAWRWTTTDAIYRDAMGEEVSDTREAAGHIYDLLRGHDNDTSSSRMPQVNIGRCLLAGKYVGWRTVNADSIYTVTHGFLPRSAARTMG